MKRWVASLPLLLLSLSLYVQEASNEVLGFRGDVGEGVSREGELGPFDFGEETALVVVIEGGVTGGSGWVGG